MIRAFLVLSVAAAAAGAQTCSTDRISVDQYGVEADGASTSSAISANGRFVVFVSSATNLVPGDTNQLPDIFVRDLVTGVVERVDVPYAGGEADGWASYPTISEDGRYVCYTSTATNLVPNDTNGVNDVFVFDRSLGTTERVNVSTAGAQTDSFSFAGRISADGRFVTFISFSSVLVLGDANNARDVFLRDRLAGTTERISVGPGGADTDGDSSGNLALSFVSRDGRYVVFSASAGNIVAGDTNGVGDVFLRDRQAGVTTRLSVGPGGVQADDESDVTGFSSDGRFVVFQSAATNLVPGDTNGASDVFVIDLTTGIIERVSVTSSGAESSGPAFGSTLSEDGRFVFFYSLAADLVPLDTNSARDGFRRDRYAGTTERFALAYNGGQPDNDVNSLSCDATGEILAFSSASVLVYPDQNGVSDVFVHRCVTSTSLCEGDGSGVACPCGNVGGWNAGCANSFTSGATLSSSGTASVGQDTLDLIIRGAPPGAPVLFYQGSHPIGAGGLGQPFGDGVRCIGGALHKLGIRPAIGGAVAIGFGTALGPSLSVAGGLPAYGDTCYYQAWYRNSLAFCSISPFNFSQGLVIQWGP